MYRKINGTRNTGGSRTASESDPRSHHHGRNHRLLRGRCRLPGGPLERERCALGNVVSVATKSETHSFWRCVTVFNHKITCVVYCRGGASSSSSVDIFMRLSTAFFPLWIDGTAYERSNRVMIGFCEFLRNLHRIRVKPNILRNSVSTAEFLLCGGIIESHHGIHVRIVCRCILRSETLIALVPNLFPEPSTASEESMMTFRRLFGCDGPFAILIRVRESSGVVLVGVDAVSATSRCTSTFPHISSIR